MVDIADIIDGESLEAWLNVLPFDADENRRISVSIAHRAVMRVVPFYWADVSAGSGRGSMTELPILWCCLISGVAGTWRTPGIRAAAARAIAHAQTFDAATCTAAAHTATAAHTAHTATAATAAARAVTAAAYAAHTNAAAANELWQAVREDCTALQAGTRLIALPLWPGSPPAFDDAWQELRQDWSERGSGWHFWIKWYDDALTGREPSEEMLTRIALIDPEVWAKGIEHVNGLIVDIVDQQPGDGDTSDLLQQRLMAAALADFTFDGMRRLMDMVPFEDDIRHLRDDARRNSFLDDAQELVAGLEDFSKAVAASQSKQGVPELQAYIDNTLSELSRALQLEHLRVRRLLDLGAVLQDFSLEDGCRMGLGDVMAKQLDRLVATMLDLTRSHFAPSILRLKPLDDLVLLPGEVPGEIIKKLETNLAAMRRVKGDGIVPLNPQDIAVLGDFLQELRRLARAIESTEVAESKKELENQFARKAGQLGVTFGRYWIIARQGKFGDNIDAVLKQFKRAKGLSGLLEWLGSLWDKLPWP